MAKFEFIQLDLEGAYLIDYFFTGDNRGHFAKIFEEDIYKREGIDFNLNECFTSMSMKNVIRGLHFQKCNPQSKIVSVVAGKIWDVMVDLRPNSPTFKEWRAHELSAENHLAFFIPRGFAHGFLSLEDGTVILYQCDGRYDSHSDSGIIFNDPEIGIKWPIEESATIHSSRDLRLECLQEYLKNPITL